MTTPSSLPHRADIQGLRALAILLVVLAHAGVRGFSGGFVGVDLFFVLSGYLITGLLIREYEIQKSIKFARFFSRRLKRLLPSLLTMLCAVVLAAPFILTPYEIRNQGASFGYAATWTSNLFFALSDLDYFAELQTRDLFLHTWSLGVEEQFYLLWPGLLLVMFKSSSCRFPASTHAKRLLVFLGLLFVGSLALCWYLASAQPRWSFYLMPSRIWQFSLGASVFVWLHGKGAEKVSVPGFARWLRVGCGIIGLALIIGSGIWMRADMTYPGFWALLPSLGAAMLIAVGHASEEGGVAKLLGHPALVWLGDRSYALYLWHWPVLMLGFALGLHRHPKGIVGLLAISMMLAVLSYRLVEQPFWKGRFSHAAPMRIVLASVLAMIIVIPASKGYLIRALATKANALPDLSVSDAMSPNLAAARAARLDAPAPYKQGCDSWYSSSKVRPCVFGSDDAPRVAVLIGDSIGTQWFSFLPEIFESPEWRIEVLTKSACPIVDEDYYYSRLKTIYTVCSEWRHGVLDYVESLRPDIVFLGSSANYNFSEAQWTDGAARVLARLTASVRNVVVIPGTPNLSFDGPACLERNESSLHEASSTDESNCGELLKDASSRDVAHYLDRAVQRFPNAKLLDLNDLVCPDGYCAARSSDGLVVFRDTQHVTDSFVRARVPVVLERLRSLGLGQTWANYTSRAEDHHGH